MELKLDATIYSDFDGKEVGKLRFAVFDPKTARLDSLIIRLGLVLERRDVMVAAQHISAVSWNGQYINLNLSKAELENQPDFIEAKYVIPVPDGSTTLRADEPLTPPSFISYGGDVIDVEYTPLETRLVVATPLVAYPTEPVNMADGELEARVEVEHQQERLVPEDGFRLGHDTKVVDKYDLRLGHLNRVLLDETRKLVQLLVKEDAPFKQEAAVPADWVESITSEVVVLRYSKEEILKMLGNPVEYR
jgi:sporulation protein YlmC with PRC-barrel domain